MHDGALPAGFSQEAPWIDSWIPEFVLVLQDLDDRLESRGLDISAVRTYNSQGLLNDDNGDNWMVGAFGHRYELALASRCVAFDQLRGAVGPDELPGTCVVGDGVEGAGAGRADIQAARDVPGVDCPGAIPVDARERAAGGPKRVRCQLDALTDPGDNTIAFAYDANNTLQSMTNANGEVTHFDYTGPQLTQIRAVAAGGATLTRVRYAYDTSNAWRESLSI